MTEATTAPQEDITPVPQKMTIEEALPMLALILDGTDAELCDVYSRMTREGQTLKPHIRHAAYKIAEKHVDELTRRGIEIDPVPSLSDLVKADPAKLLDPDIQGWFKRLKERDELEYEVAITEAKITTKMRAALEKGIRKTLESPLLGEVVEYPEDIMAEARNILDEGEAVQYIMDTYKSLHVGDETAGMLIFCTQFTPHIKNSKGLHPKITGESGKGKTAVVDTVTHQMPEEWYIKTSLSSKAPFYNKKIRRGIVIYCDDYRGNEDIDTIMKCSTSQFHNPYKHLTVDRGRDGLKGRTVEVPEEIVWAISSVDSDQDIQVLNRVVPLDVDDSPATDRGVVNKLLIEAEEGVEELPESHEVLVCRAILRILKSKRYYVSIPFARRIYFRDASNRRNPSMFLDIVRALAFWSQYKRDVDEKGRLVATEEDFYEAKRLYFGDKRGNSFKTKLTAKELELARQIVANGGRLTRQDAAQKMGVTVGRIDQLVYGKGRGNERRGGLVSKLKGFHVEKETETRRVDFEYGHSKTVQLVILVLDDAGELYDDEDAVELREKAVVEIPRDTPKIPTKIPNPPIAVDT